MSTCEIHLAGMKRFSSADQESARIAAAVEIETT